MTFSALVRLVFVNITLIRRRRVHLSWIAAACAAVTAVAIACSPGTTSRGGAPLALTLGTSPGDVVVHDSTSLSTAVVRAPNTRGRIPILEYHLIGDADTRWTVEREHFRRDLQLLYDRGYRPITVSQLVDKKIDLPAGLSPVIFTFDDASPSQFRYVAHDSTLTVDPTSALGIWLDFHNQHPDWENRADFCVLPAAAAGHAFFGDRGIEGQQSAWRFKKLRYLAQLGFELCDHTLWHANLGKYSDGVVQEQIARGQLAIDSAVPGYTVRTFALPLGVWPKNRDLARAGAWRDPKTGREVRYTFDAILEVAGGPAPSPYDPAFDPHRLPRVEVFANELERTLDALDKSGTRYVSGGPYADVSAPPDAHHGKTR
ncbi:MAG TPA: polysaccharide deacetylase family protein [Gemmatimonadaceae bacterium]|nr:polysaccharide deacetylase family protein [Gemmatimonadaceae bacterium]